MSDDDNASIESGSSNGSSKGLERNPEYIKARADCEKSREKYVKAVDNFQSYNISFSELVCKNDKISTAHMRFSIAYLNLIMMNPCIEGGYAAAIRALKTEEVVKVSLDSEYSVEDFMHRASDFMKSKIYLEKLISKNLKFIVGYKKIEKGLMMIDLAMEDGKKKRDVLEDIIEKYADDLTDSLDENPIANAA
jgi:hypothetical protein